MSTTPAPVAPASDARAKRLYTVDEVSALLSLSRPTLYELMNSGRLRSVKVLRCRRIPAEALEDFLQALGDE
jgi:excisionase family DNA binding protein